MNIDTRGTKILARSFFNDLRARGYTSMQIIGIASELIDLVASDIRGGDKAVPTEADGSIKREMAQGA